MPGMMLGGGVTRVAKMGSMTLDFSKFSVHRGRQTGKQIITELICLPVTVS